MVNSKQERCDDEKQSPAGFPSPDIGITGIAIINTVHNISVYIIIGKGPQLNLLLSHGIMLYSLVY